MMGWLVTLLLLSSVTWAAQAFAQPLESVALGEEIERQDHEEVERDLREHEFKFGPFSGSVSLRRGGCVNLATERARFCLNRLKRADGKKDKAAGAIFEWRF